MHTVVIGGGVIGLTVAYHLVREGETVTVVDARSTGCGASDVNAGWVVPADAIPVPGPGMVLKSVKWMLRADSPLYIHPSLRPSFLGFMFGMWRHCNATDQKLSFEGHLRLARSTLESFDQYRADGIDFEMHNQGLLMAYLKQQNLDHHRELLELARQFDLDPQVLLGDEVRSREPKLADLVYGGIYYPYERHLDPCALMRGLRQRVLELGGQIEENVPVDAVQIDSATGQPRVKSVRSGSRVWASDRYVLAAGPWSGQLSRLFNSSLPVRPGKGYSIDVAPYGLSQATNLSDAKVAVTPFAGRLRLAGTMEFAGLDENINRLRVQAILRAPTAYFRDWEPPSNPPSAKAGCRPMTPDGKPIIGRLGGLSNAFVATGHGMLGITLAPGTAAALTELILRDRLSPDLNPFSPQRFHR